jgi:hypothetical protein
MEHAKDMKKVISDASIYMHRYQNGLCTVCGDNLWLCDDDAGSDKEVYRKCDKCK